MSALTATQVCVMISMMFIATATIGLILFPEKISVRWNLGLVIFSVWILLIGFTIHLVDLARIN
jgi:hypothetical protein